MRRKIRSSGESERYYVLTSHDSNEGRINLYTGSVCDEHWMSDADLAVLDSRGRVVGIVEVKFKDVRPKDVLGVVHATSLCSVLCHRGKEHSLQKPILYVVVDAKTVNKPGSSKMKQLNHISEKLHGKIGSLRKTVICTDREFADKFRV